MDAPWLDSRGKTTANWLFALRVVVICSSYSMMRWCPGRLNHYGTPLYSNCFHCSSTRVVCRATSWPRRRTTSSTWIDRKVERATEESKPPPTSASHRCRSDNPRWRPTYDLVQDIVLRQHPSWHHTPCLAYVLRCHLKLDVMWAVVEPMLPRWQHQQDQQTHIKWLRQ